jgi:hypothetical protein
VGFIVEALVFALLSEPSSLAIIVCFGKGTCRNRDEIAKLKQVTKFKLSIERTARADSHQKKWGISMYSKYRKITC